MHGRRGPGVPLRDRGSVQVTTDTSRPVMRPAGRAPTTRHAWATLEPGQAPIPALVISWHQSPTGWMAWVVVVLEEQAATRYLPATQLRPAHTITP